MNAQRNIHALAPALLTAGALITGSCNNNGCLENQSAIPLAGFYSADTEQQVMLPGLQIGGEGAPNDSLLLDGTSANQVYLPMRSTATSVRWRFHYIQQGIDSPQMDDILEFDYTSKPYFASEECGAMYYYTITAVRHTTHLIDSVAVTDSLVTNLDTERIRIYFRTIQDSPQETPGGGSDPQTL